ncbi:hypothetical protein [Tindallia californiensis]|uniref:Uncharacterized protein n=1 Tax=Tindallia californiensis TaxID=159292 RepID=A0A1H3IV35_9FIRM|nr:hypothetical protein [Tindallia californiensis]SDY31522.1 hypothetical protein SAMN05192546_101298 [Tindallia californiensis]
MKKHHYFTILMLGALSIFLLVACGGEKIEEKKGVDVPMPWEDPWFLPVASTPQIETTELGIDIRWPGYEWSIDDSERSRNVMIYDFSKMKAFEIDVEGGDIQPVSLEEINHYYQNLDQVILEMLFCAKGILVISQDSEGHYDINHHWGEAYDSVNLLIEKADHFPDLKMNKKRNRIIVPTNTKGQYISYHVINQKKTEIDIELETEEIRIQVSPEGGYIAVEILDASKEEIDLRLYGADSGRKIVSGIPGIHAAWGLDDSVLLFRHAKTQQVGIYFRERRQISLLGQLSEGEKVIEGPYVSADGYHALYINKNQEDGFSLSILHLYHQIEKTVGLSHWDHRVSLADDVYYHGDTYLLIRGSVDRRKELLIQDNKTGAVMYHDLSEETPFFFLKDKEIYYLADVNENKQLLRTDFNKTENVIIFSDKITETATLKNKEGVILYRQGFNEEKAAWLIR